MSKHTESRHSEMSRLITFKDLEAGFPEFLMRFNASKHAPFAHAELIEAVQPGTRKDAFRRLQLGLPPIYHKPETDFVARIVLSPSLINWDTTGLAHKTYTYYITETGAINFKAPFLFTTQPKMKWAAIISRWLQMAIPAYRQLARTDAIKEELMATVYSPERVMATYPDITHLQY